MNSNDSQEEKLQQQVQQLEIIVRQRLTSDALSRFGNIKASNPQLAIQLIIYLSQLIQAGKINMVNDAQLKSMLQKLITPKRDFKITRK